MTPLIDMDILLYEIGFSCQRMVDGKLETTSWEYCQDMLDNKLKLIADEVQATEPPILFMTNSPFINKLRNRERRLKEEQLIEFKPNFRETIAVSKGYKAGRSSVKPFHYRNLISYALNSYNTIVNENGLEADDAICIIQRKMGDKSTICSRDKDLRQMEGWHYSWECGKQASVGPVFIEQPGYIQLISPPKKISEKTGKEISGGPPKVFGYGHKYFYSQLLVGDNVDNVGGVINCGPVAAFNLLDKLTDEREMFEAVREVYKSTYKDEWKIYMKEQANLLWMIRELDKDGNAVLWQPPDSKWVKQCHEEYQRQVLGEESPAEAFRASLSAHP